MLEHPRRYRGDYLTDAAYAKYLQLEDLVAEVASWFAHIGSGGATDRVVVDLRLALGLPVA